MAGRLGNVSDLPLLVESTSQLRQMLLLLQLLIGRVRYQPRLAPVLLLELLVGRRWPPRHRARTLQMLARVLLQLLLLLRLLLLVRRLVSGLANSFACGDAGCVGGHGVLLLVDLAQLEGSFLLGELLNLLLFEAAFKFAGGAVLAHFEQIS